MRAKEQMPYQELIRIAAELSDQGLVRTVAGLLENAKENGYYLYDWPTEDIADDIMDCADYAVRGVSRERLEKAIDAVLDR